MKFLYLPLALLLMVMSLAPTSAEERANALAFLPDDTMVVMTLENVAKFRQELSQFPFYQFVQEKSWQQFMEKPLKKLRSELSKNNMANQMSLLEEYWQNLDIVQGQVALALLDIQPPEEGLPLPVVEAVLVADIGENQDRLQQLLDKFWLNQEETLIPVEEEFMGETIVYLKPNPEKVEQMPVSVCYSTVGNFFIVGISDGGVKTFISRFYAEEAVASVLDAPLYTQTMQACALEEEDSTFYVNIERCAQVAAPFIPEDNLPAVEMGLEIAGLSKIKSLGGISDFLVGKQGSKSKFFMFMPEGFHGFLRMFEANNVEAKPSHVPADAFEYAVATFSPQIIWDTYRDFMEAFAGPGAFGQQVQQLETRLQFSLSEDLLPTLGSELQTYKDYKKPYSFLSERTIFSLSLKNAEKFHSYLDKILEVFQLPLIRSEYMQTTVYSMRVSPHLPEEFKDNFALAVVDNSLVVSNKKSGLEKRIRMAKSSQGSLSGDARYQNAVKAVKGVKNFFQYIDYLPQIEFFVDLLNNHEEKMVSQMQTGLADWVDFTKMPSKDLLKKYFGVAQVSRLFSREDGLIYEGNVVLPK